MILPQNQILLYFECIYFIRLFFIRLNYGRTYVGLGNLLVIVEIEVQRRI